VLPLKILRPVLLGAALLACTHAPAQTRLPALGDGAEITLGDERRLGERIIRELYRDPNYIDDPLLQEYVLGIWQPLLAAARTHGQLSAQLQQRFAWEILLGRDRSVNAFALPGGYLGVHLGLIGVVGTRDELASVLAHELSHVTQRHIARMFAHQNRQTPLMLGAMILGALAAGSNPDAGMAMVVGGQALAAHQQLSFSRDMEREADRMGFNLMEPAGFAPQGFVSMFDKLQQANRLNDNASWPYLRSHPLTRERMADALARIPAHASAAPVPTLEHAMLAARARVLARPGVDLLRQWAAQPQTAGFTEQSTTQQTAQAYAAVLSAMQLRDWAGARAALVPLQAATAQDAAALRQTRLLQAELELAAGEPAAALAALPQPDTLAPGTRHSGPLSLDSVAASDNASGGAQRRPELLLRTQILLRQNASASMAAALQTWVSQHPRDAAAWQLLAQVWHAQGQALRALRAEAEARAAHYDYPAALDRLKAAQNLARQGGQALDHIEASIVDTRLRAVEQLLRTQEGEW